MTDFTDNITLRNSWDDSFFQERCRLRFINAAISILSEELTFYASVAQAGGTTITFASAPTGVTAGMTAEDLTTVTAIPHFLTVSSIATNVVTMSGTVTGLLANDQVVFNIAGMTHAVHVRRTAFAGALLAGNVELKMLAMVILANSTNRTNCLANPNQSGGNILDSDIDFTVNSNFTGIALSRNW